MDCNSVPECERPPRRGGCAALKHYDFLFKRGRLQEAKAEFERAAAMTRNERERALLLERAGRC